jgi:CubicO group peptidase (beta-lactamase class C family)
MRATISFLPMAALLIGASAAQPPALRTLPEVERQAARGDLGKIVALELEHQGAVRWSRRFDGRGPEQLHDIRSAGKSITALAVGMAIADGKLSLDDRVWPRLGAPQDDPHNGITVRDLLTMSSALDCDDGVSKSPGQEERMYRTRDWRAFAMAIPLDPAYKRDPQGYGRFSYCTAGVFLLGQLVQTTTGEQFDRYVASRVFGPLGIDAVEWRRSPSGEIQSGGQLKIRSGDLLRIGRMVLDHGRWRGQQVIPEFWIRDMLTPHRQPGEGSHYGYLWWLFWVPLPGGPEPSWMMSGNGGNMVAIFRRSDAVAVVQSANYNSAVGDQRSFYLIRDMVASLEQSAPANGSRRGEQNGDGR